MAQRIYAFLLDVPLGISLAGVVMAAAALTTDWEVFTWPPALTVTGVCVFAAMWRPGGTFRPDAS